MLQDELSSRLSEIDSEIQSIQAELSRFPSGVFVSAQNGEYFKWYLYNNHQVTYIPKRHRKLAEQFAVKRYLSLKMEDLIEEKSSILLFSNKLSKENSKSYNFYSSNKDIASLLDDALPVSEFSKAGLIYHSTYD